MTVLPGLAHSEWVENIREPPLAGGAVPMRLDAGDLVVDIVCRPEPVPCATCAAREWDMRRALYERGSAADALARADKDWPGRLITPRAAAGFDGGCAPTRPIHIKSAIDFMH